MPTAPITAALVKSARCPEGKDKATYFDTELTGFMLEVRASGAKTFYQRYRDERGTRHQYRVGTADVLSVSQAREKARQIMAEALYGAADPQQRRADLRRVPALSDFAHTRYLPHARDTKRSWRTDVSMLRLHILPAMGSLHLDEITTENITTLMREMKAKGYKPPTINRAPMLISTMLNLAKAWKLVPKDSENPASGVTLEHEPHRERYLTPDETRRLFDAIQHDPNPMYAKAVLLLLLTGARKGEITQARWDHVDFHRRTLLVPRSKSGKPRHIALNAQALDVIRNLDREGPYLFHSNGAALPATNLYRCWDRIRKRAGLEEMRMHDLRHSFASFLVNNGVSLYVVQNLLGHTQIRTTQRYAHLSQDTLHDAAEIAGRYAVGDT